MSALTDQLTRRQIELLAHDLEQSSQLYPLRLAAQISRRNPELLRRWCFNGTIEGFRDPATNTWVLTGKQLAEVMRKPVRPDRVPPMTLADLKRQLQASR